MTTATAARLATKPATAVGTGLEPTPGSTEALLLLAGLGVFPANTGNPDPQFTAEAISACIHRLLEVKQQQELLGAEQKELSEQLRLAHLRGDLAAQLPPARKDGTGYQVSPELVLNRRPCRRQWSYSLAAPNSTASSRRARPTSSRAAMPPAAMAPPCGSCAASRADA